MNYKELKKQLLSDPEVKAEYGTLEPEYQLSAICSSAAKYWSCRSKAWLI